MPKLKSASIQISVHFKSANIELFQYGSFAKQWKAKTDLISLYIILIKPPKSNTPGIMCNDYRINIM